MLQELEETRERVRAIIASVLPAEQGRIADDAELGRDLKADSLTLLEIALKIEDAFQISIPNSDYPQLTSVGSISARVLQLRASQPTSAAATNR